MTKKSMSKFIIKRILWVIPVILFVAVLVFTMMYFTPGDPVTMILGNTATQAQKDALRAELGLDQSYLIQLKNFLVNTFLRFDLGSSWMSNQSVAEQISVRLPYTLLVGFASVLLSILIGIPLGIVASTNQYSWKDSFTIFASLFCVSMPSFWFALVLVMLFALKLRWLPAIGIQSWKGYILPVVSISVGTIASITRQTRSSMLEVMNKDYITTARAKGQKERWVIYKHALKNALNPIITTVGGQVAGVLGGSMVVEQVFSIPGIGAYMLTAITARDYPVIRGCVLVISICFCLIMLAVDILYVVVNPRLSGELN